MIKKKVWIVVLVVAGMLVSSVPAWAYTPEGFEDWALYQKAGSKFEWAQEDIGAVTTYEIMLGFPGKWETYTWAGKQWTHQYSPTFEPDNTLTRAEFATILARVLGVDEAPRTGQSAFADVPPSAWYHRYVAFIESLGIVKKDEPIYADGLQPNMPISRKEMAAWIARAARDYGLTPSREPIRFIDMDGSGWLEDITLATTLGIINGYPDGSFKPDASVKRAEAAAMIWRFINQLTKNPPSREELLPVVRGAYDLLGSFADDRRESLPDEKEFAAHFGEYFTAPNLRYYLAKDGRTTTSGTGKLYGGGPTLPVGFHLMRIKDKMVRSGRSYIQDLEIAWAGDRWAMVKVTSIARLILYDLNRLPDSVFTTNVFLIKQDGRWKVSGISRNTFIKADWNLFPENK